MAFEQPYMIQKDEEQKAAQNQAVQEQQKQKNLKDRAQEAEVQNAELDVAQKQANIAETQAKTAKTQEEAVGVDVQNKATKVKTISEAQNQEISPKQQRLQNVLGEDPSSVDTPTNEQRDALSKQRSSLRSSSQYPPVKKPTASTKNPEGEKMVSMVRGNRGQSFMPLPKLTKPAAIPKGKSLPKFQEYQDYPSMQPHINEAKNIQSQIKNTLKKYDAIRETTSNIQKDFISAQEKGIEETRSFYKKLNELKAPSYASAIRKMPVISKALGVIAAMMNGYLQKENPTAIIDKLINMAYEDEKLAFENKKEGIEKEFSLFEKINGMTKDTYIHKLGFQKTALEALGTQIQALRNNVKDINQIAKLEGMNTERNNQIIALNNQVKQRYTDNELKKDKFSYMKYIDNINIQFKKFDAETKRYDAETKRLQAISQGLQKESDIPRSYTMANGATIKGKESMKKMDELRQLRRRWYGIKRLIPLLDRDNQNVDVSKLTSDPKTLKLYKRILKMRDDSALTRFAKKGKSFAKSMLGMSDEYKQAGNLLLADITELAIGRRIELTGGGPLQPAEVNFLFTVTGVQIEMDKEKRVVLNPDDILDGLLSSMVSGTSGQRLKKMVQDDSKNLRTGLHAIFSDKGKSLSPKAFAKEFNYFMDAPNRASPISQFKQGPK